MKTSPKTDLPDCRQMPSAAMAPKLAALSHPARLDILRHLAGMPSCCCRDVVDQLDLAQSTVSQHLKILVDAGLVKFTPDRQRSRYEINHDALSGLSTSLASLVDSCCGGPRQ